MFYIFIDILYASPNSQSQHYNGKINLSFYCNWTIEYINISKKFAKLVLAGKANAALILLTTERENEVHEANNKLISKFEEKHANPVRI